MSIFGKRPKNIEDVRRKFESCTRCVFSSMWRDTGPCLPSLDTKDKEVVVVGQWPGEEDMKNGVAFSGPQGKVSVRMLTAAGFPGSCLYFTNVLLCSCPVSPTKLILANCRESLDDTLDVVRPKLIIAMGNHAVKRMDIRESLPDVHGRMKSYRSYPVVPVIHTASINHARDDKERQKLEGLVRDDLKAAYKIYTDIKRKTP